jgi:hypothetical protein
MRLDPAGQAEHVLGRIAPERGQGELAGDESFTLADLAAEASRQTGMAIVSKKLPQANYAAALAQFECSRKLKRWVTRSRHSWEHPALSSTQRDFGTPSACAPVPLSSGTRRRHDDSMRMRWRKPKADQLELLESAHGVSRDEEYQPHQHDRSVLSTRSSTRAAPSTAGRPPVAPLERLYENPNNLRTEFPELQIDELADDIRERGILAPIVVHPRGRGWPLPHPLRRQASHSTTR